MKHRMRYAGISILMMILVAGVAFSAVAGEMGPKAAAESDTFNFDVVAEGKTVKADFAIKNTGDADLVIEEVKTG